MQRLRADHHAEHEQRREDERHHAVEAVEVCRSTAPTVIDGASPRRSSPRLRARRAAGRPAAP
jgi:hypothetical protein